MKVALCGGKHVICVQTNGNVSLHMDACPKCDRSKGERGVCGFHSVMLQAIVGGMTAAKAQGAML